MCVAGGFLRKWFGRSPEPLPSAEVSTALANLTGLAQAQPALAGPAAFLGEMIPLLFRAPVRTIIPGLNADRVRAKLAVGIPLLRGESFQLGEGALRQHWQTICEAVGHYQGSAAGQALLDALQEGRLNPGELLGFVLAGENHTLQERAAGLGIDAGVATTVFRLLLIPVLSPVSAAWAAVREGASWKEGFCPTCGSWPLLGESCGPNRPRRLRCGLCTAGWVFPNSECPFCGLEDARFLRSFGEGDAGYAATCDACRTYLKMVPAPEPLNGPQLLVADLATMHLDMAAPNLGFSAAE
jgi:FdhE protein